MKGVKKLRVNYNCEGVVNDELDEKIRVFFTGLGFDYDGSGGHEGNSEKGIEPSRDHFFYEKPPAESQEKG